ncbi:hypothetical protein Avbf_10599 [Armadillidium vulgare]|nr:hypothetical protein Avbf_10599 [Armadillidium vulgare]
MVLDRNFWFSSSDYRNKIQKGPPREEQAGRQGIRVTGTVGNRRDMVEEGRKSQERTGTLLQFQCPILNYI